MLLLDGKCVKQREVGESHYMGQHVTKRKEKGLGKEESHRRVYSPRHQTPRAHRRLSLAKPVCLVKSIKL